MSIQSRKISGSKNANRLVILPNKMKLAGIRHQPRANATAIIATLRARTLPASIRIIGTGSDRHQQ
jgi:hypothetical protein